MERSGMWGSGMWGHKNSTGKRVLKERPISASHGAKRNGGVQELQRANVQKITISQIIKK
ncbi:hypothetical protein Barb4_02338 [Bacteroidales bacterium Barb4]|nr:hypothetical protein Barb4_02338 [Bacteroidales bacterium Barb4]